MGATGGYFILLCALNLAAAADAVSSPSPVTSVSSSDAGSHGAATYAASAKSALSLDPTHPAASTGKDVAASPDTRHASTAPPHLLHVTTTESSLTSTAAFPAHPAASTGKDVAASPDTTRASTAPPHLLHATTESSLTSTAASPIHPSTPSGSGTDVITKPASEPIHTAKTYLLTASKRAETHSGLGTTTAYELSKPKIEYKDVHNKTLEISCFSEHGPLPITYSIIQNQAVVLKSLTVFSRKPANFTIEMTPGSSAGHMCKAESRGQFRFSDPLMKINISEEEDTTARSEDEKDGDNSGPKHLITLSHILTSVNRVVQHRNTILISVCGPVILFVLGIYIVVSHICHRRKNGDRP